MSKIHLTDRQWAFKRLLLPLPARIRRPGADNRRTIESILYVLITVAAGRGGKDRQREYGAPTTVWRRLRRSGEDGIWERVWRAALAALDRQGST